jgi:hypothetical protein
MLHRRSYHRWFTPLLRVRGLCLHGSNAGAFSCGPPSPLHSLCRCSLHRPQWSSFGTHSSLLPYYAPTTPFPAVLQLTPYAATWWYLRACRPCSPVCHAHKGKRDLWGTSVRVVEKYIPAFTAAAPFSSSCLSSYLWLLVIEAYKSFKPAGRMLQPRPELTKRCTWIFGGRLL